MEINWWSSKPLCCIAPDLHVALHSPQPLQRAEFTSATPFSVISIALYGQTSTHNPHPTHLVSSTEAIVASVMKISFDMIVQALDAAAYALKLFTIGDLHLMMEDTEQSMEFEDAGF